MDGLLRLGLNHIKKKNKNHALCEIMLETGSATLLVMAIPGDSHFWGWPFLMLALMVLVTPGAGQSGDGHFWWWPVLLLTWSGDGCFW